MPRLRLSLIAILCVVLALNTMDAQVIKPKPITKNGLVDALKIGGLTTGELVSKIKERGVSFAVTPATENELGKAGAAPEVIQAARDNRRPANHLNPSR